MASKVSANTQQLVRLRANFLCEYCHAHEKWQHIPFTFDHLVPSSADGETIPDNLALACFHCNRRKSNKQLASDPLTEQIAPIFNPRLHKWQEHFIWSADCLRIIPLTEIGRATEALLNFNRERVLRIRAADLMVKRHPPEADPVQPI